jgi:NADH-quinone oxidoreductase subunit C
LENGIVNKIKQRFPDSILESTLFRGEITIRVKKEDLLEIGHFLKEEKDLLFNFLSLLCGVDYFPRKPRFEVVYHLYSFRYNQRLRLKVPVDGEPPVVPSVTSIWPGANWHERETYDLLGIQFQGHPDLRRILLPDDWEGHPLRKDYPLRGLGDPPKELQVRKGD